MNSDERKKLESLKRRELVLSNRLATWDEDKGNPLPTRREASALRWAIKIIEGQAPSPSVCTPVATGDGGDRFNGGVKCDVDEGPCACGAWHRTSEAFSSAYLCHGFAVPSGERCPECKAPAPLDGSRPNEARPVNQLGALPKVTGRIDGNGTWQIAENIDPCAYSAIGPWRETREEAAEDVMHACDGRGSGERPETPISEDRPNEGQPANVLGLREAAQLIFDMSEIYQHVPRALDALRDVRRAILERAGRDPKGFV